MLCVQVLGPLGADIGGTPVHLGSPRQRAVLALLMANRGNVVPVDRLIDRLWCGRPPEKAPASLHAYVSNLRRVLEPGRAPRTPSGVLVSAPPGYALRLPQDAVDAWRFEEAVRRARTLPPPEARRLLEEALGWWRGAAYGEWADEEWAGAEAARLAELHSVARELAVEATLRSGAATEAVPCAEALVREHPLREEGWRLLALALWASGRRADALAELRRATAVLAEELGLGPGEVLAGLQSAMLTDRTEVLRAVVPGAGPSETSASVAPSAGATVTSVRVQQPAAPPLALRKPGRDPVPLSDPEVAPVPADEATVAPLPSQEPFVGRDTELRALDDAARGARLHGGVVLVTGEAGAGKSALLGRFQQRLRADGWTVVIGRCPEFDGAPPAWAWTEALGELARRTPPADPASLGALLHDGEYGGHGDHDRHPSGQGPEQDPGFGDGWAVGRFRTHRAFSAWLRSAAGASPLAVVIDDLHRADGETLALLERTAELTGVPVLVIAAYRPAETGDRLAETLAELAHRSPHRLALGGLPSHAVDTVVRALCGAPVDAATVTALAERTGGNPFYVRESARLLASEGALVAISEVPQGVRDVLRRRLRQLQPGALAVLQLASVVGRESEVSVLIEAADPERHPEHEVFDSLEECVLAGLLTEPAPGLVRFAHALVRDTVYTDLVGVRRARLHARVADVVRRRRPDDLAALAHHFSRSATAATASLAVEYSLGAADLAERRYAHDAAAELLKQAIESFALIPVDDEITGDARAARLVALLGRLLRAEIRAGAVVSARSTRQRAIEAASGVGHDALVSVALGASIGPGLALSGPQGLVAPSALDHFADRLAARAASDPVVLALVARAAPGEQTGPDSAGHGDRGNRSEAPCPVGERAAAHRLAVARAVGDPLLISCALTAASAAAPEGSPDHRALLASELRVLGYAHDLPANTWVREHISGMAAGALNDVAGVRRHTREGRAVARRHRLVEAEVVNLSTQAMLAHVEGRFADAETGYTDVRDRLRANRSAHGDLVHTLGLTTVRLSQGRPEDAEPLLRSVHDPADPVTSLALSVVLARQGRLDEAHALGVSPSAPTPDHLYSIALSFRAELACLLEDHRAARELVPLLLPVRGQLAGAASISFVTRPLAQSLGEIHRLLGDETAALREFTRAEEVALRWGSPHLTAAARAAAAVPDATGRDGPEGLDPEPSGRHCLR
ncbi:BTAD domain-containing putative transcriptional regulator [Streptomyces sp. NPDC058305]|uniref:BTAD domain-containing putative transcriptional regulator n=1 Tax=Streptomyces sp. NPDC058305 TaxID=3346438 RepID=UPI0036EDD056